ncbi:MAG: MBL fold metallo-hydrolase [Candidatus Bathyarchaeota archaeon]|jgi:glyoxylase-like metal-dependent hydrolase (beta-lactamase superfamily II)
MVEILKDIHSIDFSDAKDHGRELWILDCPEGTVLVDTGMGEKVLEEIEEVLSSIGKVWEDVEIILITHRHGDHIGNLSKVSKLTGAKVMAHEDEVQTIRKQTGVEVKGLEHGGHLPYCGGIEIIHIPGHTEGNCCYYLSVKRAIIAGDTIFGDEDGNLIPPPERYCLDVKQATHGIERLLSYDFDALIYTHGRDVMKGARARVRELVESVK